jgi:hypothetical protein
MMFYALIAGVVLFFGATLVYALKRTGRLKEKVEQYQLREKAMRKINEYARKRRKKTVSDTDAPDKLEPWL